MPDCRSWNAIIEPRVGAAARSTWSCVNLKAARWYSWRCAAARVPRTAAPAPASPASSSGASCSPRGTTFAPAPAAALPLRRRVGRRSESSGSEAPSMLVEGVIHADVSCSADRYHARPCSSNASSSTSSTAPTSSTRPVRSSASRWPRRCRHCLVCVTGGGKILACGAGVSGLLAHAVCRLFHRPLRARAARTGRRIALPD